MTSQHKATIGFVTILLIGLSLISLEVTNANARSSPRGENKWPVMKVSMAKYILIQAVYRVRNSIISKTKIKQRPSV